MLFILVGSAFAVSNEEFKQLDTFEAHRLTKADEVFKKRDYKQAFAEYDSFILEFPQSKALAYALLQKARCLHLNNKRFEAIKAYREVLDYFPNVVNYAAPALYYTGQTHWENNDNEKAVTAWAQMAADKEYSRHPLGASAFNELGAYLLKQNKPDDAARYFQQVAVTFRTSNPAEARQAIEQTVRYFVRIKFDEPALRAFYAQVQTFDAHPRKIEGDVAASRNYWDRIVEAVKRYGDFPADQQALREKFFRYWADAMEGKFTDWDDFQISLAELRLTYERDTQKWFSRLDKQFSQHQKPGDHARVNRWIRLYRDHKSKVTEYFGKYDFSKMTTAQLIEVMRLAYEEVQDPTMGRSVYDRIPFGQLKDQDKVGLIRFFRRWAPGMVANICRTLEDKELGQMELLRFYAANGDEKNGLPLAQEMMKSPTYSAEALRIKADLLYGAKQYDKALLAYQALDNPPHNLWMIAACYEHLGKIDQAISQLREVENFFKEHSADAALRIAHVYQRANRRDQYIAALRAVLKKYKKSGQSSSAHQELEQLNVRIGGGVDAGE